MIEKARFQAQCREQKEKLLKKYIDELKEIDAEINYEEEIKKYYIALEQEDVQTPEMYLSIYPFLISLIRNKEERVSGS